MHAGIVRQIANFCLPVLDIHCPLLLLLVLEGIFLQFIAVQAGQGNDGLWTDFFEPVGTQLTCSRQSPRSTL